jgi:Flp pilus assembly protein protease CpaA
MLDGFFIGAIVLLGVLTSYTDINYGKIRNKHNLLGLVIAVAIYGFGVYNGETPLSIARRAALGFAICLSICFLMWKMKFWSAGDAKLFSVFYALLPASIYTLVRSPLVDLIINSVLPLFVFIFVAMLLKTTIKQKKAALAELFNPDMLINLVLIVFSISWLTKYVFLFLNIKKNYLLNIILIQAFFVLMEKFTGWKVFKGKIQLIHIILGICAARLIFDRAVYSLAFWKAFAILTIGYSLLRILIKNLGKTFIKRKRVIELKEGDIVADRIVEHNDKYRKKRGMLFSYGNLFRERVDPLFTQDADGLTKEDLKRIKEMYEKKKLMFETVKVCQTLPFAPFIFLGALITAIVKNVFLVYFM